MRDFPSLLVIPLGLALGSGCAAAPTRIDATHGPAHLGPAEARTSPSEGMTASPWGVGPSEGVEHAASRPDWAPPGMLNVQAEDGTVYLVGAAAWLPSGNVTTTVDSTPVRANLDFSDALSLEQWGASLQFEAWPDDATGFLADFSYLTVDADFDVQATPGAEINVGIDDVTLDLLYAGRTTFVESLGEQAPQVTFDALAGLRCRYLSQQLDVQPGPRLSDSNSWVEPVVGGRLTLPTSPAFAWVARGDMSGFGIGSGSDLTWNAALEGQYELNAGHALALGYRWYGIDYSRGTGRDQTGLDGNFNGVQAAWTMRF